MKICGSNQVNVSQSHDIAGHGVEEVVAVDVHRDRICNVHMELGAVNELGHNSHMDLGSMDLSHMDCICQFLGHVLEHETCILLQKYLKCK